jgi:predicted kinase
MVNEETNILEWNRKSEKASKEGRKPKEGPRSKQKEKPSAIVTVGLPGSGKSTIARHMVSKGDTDQHEFDKSRRELGKGPAYFGPDLAAHTYGGVKRSAERGKNTALTNTTIPKPHRHDAVQKLKDAGYSKVDVILAPGSNKAAIRRNRKRTESAPGEGKVPEFVMNRMAQGMKSISRAEKREMRSKYKELHKKYRFTKPAMKRSGAIREDYLDEAKYEKNKSRQEKELIRNREGRLQNLRRAAINRRLSAGRYYGNSPKSADAENSIRGIRRESVKTFNEFILEAREATRATTRGRRLDPGKTQREVAKADREREARERAAERKERAADEIIFNLQKQGREEKEAAAARANPEAQRKKALRRTLAQRMAAAAEKRGIEN